MFEHIVPEGDVFVLGEGARIEEARPDGERGHERRVLNQDLADDGLILDVELIIVERLGGSDGRPGWELIAWEYVVGCSAGRPGQLNRGAEGSVRVV